MGPLIAEDLEMIQIEEDHHLCPPNNVIDTLILPVFGDFLVIKRE